MCKNGACNNKGQKFATLLLRSLKGNCTITDLNKINSIVVDTFINIQ